jgi:hypothetical protein
MIEKEDIIRMAILAKLPEQSYERELVRFANLIETFVLNGYPDADGNYDIEIGGHYLGRGQVVSVKHTLNLFGTESK